MVKLPGLKNERLQNYIAGNRYETNRGSNTAAYQIRQPGQVFAGTPRSAANRR
jgi:hypothetical protein